jgi:hypothetical protein
MGTVNRLTQNETVRVGLNWGAIGGVAGFVSGLLGAFSAILIAGFIGYYCGKRAAGTARGESPGRGASAGLVAGCIATPVYVMGAAVGSTVAVRGLGMEEVARTIEEWMGAPITPDEAWLFFLLSLLVAAVVQAAVLVLFSTLGGALALRRREREGMKQ